jgi:hypothetical protein
MVEGWNSDSTHFFAASMSANPGLAKDTLASRAVANTTRFLIVTSLITEMEYQTNQNECQSKIGRARIPSDVAF